MRLTRPANPVAALVGAKSSEIVFTSGGTEADNLAIVGVVGALSAGHSVARKHVITSSIEHHAVLNTCQELEARGVEVSYVPVNARGLIDPAEVRRALRPETLLITVMHANNELGTIQPIEEIGQIAKQAGVRFHCDAVQSAGKLPLDVDSTGSGSTCFPFRGTKSTGRRGAGALYVRSGVSIAPLFHGGHAERDRRAGTENVPGIVGMGKAAELARKQLAADASRVRALRDRLEEALLEKIPTARVNGDRTQRVPNTANFTFSSAGGEALVIALDLQGVECSSGAACSSGSVEPSHVLTAIGLSDDEARSSIRISLGRPTAAAEIDQAIRVIPGVVERLRAALPKFGEPEVPAR